MTFQLLTSLLITLIPRSYLEGICTKLLPWEERMLRSFKIIDSSRHLNLLLSVNRSLRINVFISLGDLGLGSMRHHTYETEN